jgi:hypothetical protein
MQQLPGLLRLQRLGAFQDHSIKQRRGVVKDEEGT